MKQMTPMTSDVQPPEVTGHETRMEMFHRAGRKAVPLRKTFIQALRGTDSRHGPLKEFVNNGDLRGLRAYLMVVGACSKANEDGWTTTHDSMVWARLFDTHINVTAQSARTAAWRTLQRLEDRGLLICDRPRGSTRISVTLLREDGQGAPYTRPDGTKAEDRWVNLPIAFWKRQFDEQIEVPGLAMLLAVAAGKAWSRFPAERSPEWYGWSPDTTERGLRKLIDLGLADRREAYVKAPLSPSGHTLVYEYNLKKWMRPARGKKPGSTS
ncbi:hypothetical protein ACWDA7_12390 [Streptomyces sp. NPDC001156]